MNRDDIIRMMQSACDTDKVDAWHNDFWWVTQDDLERFAALVAADKEAQMIRDGWRKCAENQRTTQFCGLLEEVMKAEREACARMVDHTYGKAIRARGEA